MLLDWRLRFRVFGETSFSVPWCISADMEGVTSVDLSPWGAAISVKQKKDEMTSRCWSRGPVLHRTGPGLLLARTYWCHQGHRFCFLQDGDLPGTDKEGDADRVYSVFAPRAVVPSAMYGKSRPALSTKLGVVARSNRATYCCGV